MAEAPRTDHREDEFSVLATSTSTVAAHLVRHGRYDLSYVEPKLLVHAQDRETGQQVSFGLSEEAAYEFAAQIIAELDTNRTMRRRAMLSLGPFGADTPLLRQAPQEPAGTKEVVSGSEGGTAEEGSMLDVMRTAQLFHSSASKSLKPLAAKFLDMVGAEPLAEPFRASQAPHEVPDEGFEALVAELRALLLGAEKAPHSPGPALRITREPGRGVNAALKRVLEEGYQEVFTFQDEGRIMAFGPFAGYSPDQIGKAQAILIDTVDTAGATGSFVRALQEMIRTRRIEVAQPGGPTRSVEIRDDALIVISESTAHAHGERSPFAGMANYVIEIDGVFGQRR